MRPSSITCANTETATCLNGDRFKLTATFRDVSGNGGGGRIADASTPPHEPFVPDRLSR